MLAPMARRGPDRRLALSVGNAGFGQALLATTPEALAETQPWVHPDSGCVVVSDSRLDNRPELLAALGLTGRSIDAIGDGELLYAAYQRWGSACADRLRGDFAFVIWNPQQQTLFCARDIMGVRPFYFHHTPGRLFAFASDTDSLLAVPDIPHRLNEGRIADALVDELEGIDRTSTFFLDIARLPPARTLQLAGGVVAQTEYWNPLKTRPNGLPTTDEEWTEALHTHLIDAVRSCLRSSHRVGAMVSGGLDSSSAAALAQTILATDHGETLATFSAINSQGECPETAAIRSMLAAFAFDATTVDLQHPDAVIPAVRAQRSEMREPFDASMTLLSTVYAAAAAAGVRSILDGVPADNLYTSGHYFKQLARSGQWRHAWREAYALHRTDRTAHPQLRAWQTLVGTFAPVFVRRCWDYLSDRRFYRSELLQRSLISPAFAQRVSLWERFRIYRNDMAHTRVSDTSGRAQTIMTAAYITAAIERYNRVASFHGIEPRHPFLDRQMIEFHAWMPLHLRLHSGHYKWILRQAMRNVLPADIAWRRGKEHLGSQFSCRIHPFQGVWLPEASHDRSATTLLADAIDREKLLAAQTATARADPSGGLPAACAVIDWAERL